MNNLELINKINDFSFENNDEGLIGLMNSMIFDCSYKKNLSLFFTLISITEMYGFIAYLNKEERKMFEDWDKFKSSTYVGNKMQYYNKGQLSLIYELDKYKKVFLSAPTSFGKTSLVIEYILNEYKILGNILFVVPTNSLLEELYQKMLLLNKSFNMNYSISTQPRLAEKIKNFLLLTPERFLLLSESIKCDQFDLIVMDETYKIVNSKNEVISDFLNSRALRFRKVADMIGSSSKRVIFLSPFTYELTDSMKNFIEKYNVKKIDRKIEYVNREIYKIENSFEFKERFKVDIPGYKKKSSQSNKVNFLLEQLKNEKNLVYVSNYAEAYRIVDDLSWTKECKNNVRFSKFIKHLEANYDIGTKHEWKIITGLKKGVGIYIAPLPRYIKKEIVKLFEDNILGCLIITTSFTEGVNTNASNLIFTTLVNGPTSNKLSEIDILNVSGRAGRFSKSSIGRIYCISDSVYEKVNYLQKQSSVKLENYNYMYNHNIDVRNDYEIDMIDDVYLTDKEKESKKELLQLAERLNLSTNDLNISLNVSLKWKLIIYFSLKKNNDDIDEIFKACKNIINDEPDERVKSLNILFNFLKTSFDKYEIDGFPCRPYDIKAFDNNNKFIWGRLYKIYCSGKTKDIIKKNIKFISSEFDSLRSKKPQASCRTNLEQLFTLNNKNWILKYYNENLTLNFDAFFTETFKFISNIVQYKIPFYVSFITSMVKLYIEKNKLDKEYDTTELDSKKSVLLFESGNIVEDYQKLIDYGFSNDIILKLYDNKIDYKDFLSLNFDQSLFDEYELMLIREYLLIQ